jgi:hypothetical protein
MTQIIYTDYKYVPDQIDARVPFCFVLSTSCMRSVKFAVLRSSAEQANSVSNAFDFSSEGNSFRISACNIFVSFLSLKVTTL